MKYFLPAFALVWLGMIYAAVLSGHVYRPALSLQPAPNQPPGVFVVVNPALSAASAGARAGAIVDTRGMRLADRARLLHGAQKGMTVYLPVRTAEGMKMLRLPAVRQARSATPGWTTIFDLAVNTFALLLAGYLGYRKPGMMIFALILYLGGGDLSWPAFAVLLARWPDALYGPALKLLEVLCDWFPVLVLASFAVRFPGDQRAGPGRAAVRAVDATVVAGFLLAFLPVFDTLGLNRAYIDANAAAGVVIVIASLLSFRYAPPAERSRVGVVFAAVMVGGVGYAINMIAFQYTGNFVPFYWYATLSVIVVPVSVAYAILRHRIFDIAFVLNRALVYAVTSACVLVALAAMEFAAERYLSSLTHVEGVLVEFGIALAIIVSVRLVHRRVDRVVDSLLFRARHEQESGLRRFATTAQFYTAQSALVRDTVDTLVRFGRVRGAAIYVAEETALRCASSAFALAPPGIDENDPAYVELRAHHETLQIHHVPTAFPGEYLYPMILAGRMIGVACVGERESGELMPPDIDDAIVRITSAVALTIAAIETQCIRDENAALRARLTAAPA